jgi:hypothetical protein
MPEKGEGDRGPPLSPLRSATCLGVTLAILLASAGRAQALIVPPVTVDGPSAAITDFGGVAMAQDGTGGLVYVKSVAGTSHIFASRFSGGSWSAPMRVDWEQPFEAGQPCIAAGPGGELIVAWVTEVATVHGKIQYGLYSARISPGASGFGPSQPVDPNVGEGIDVDPSLSFASPTNAIVAYRVITQVFGPNSQTTAVQLRPGDVMADIRVARFSGDRWSRLGAVNRNSEASMRPPSPTNGPEVGTGLDGSAVVAWQEPDQTGAARIWMRRVFGTTLGQVLQVSPSTWEGKPVTADADAFSLTVTSFAMARVAFRIAKTGGSALGGRILVNSLPPNFSNIAANLTGAQLADGTAAVGAVGPPGVATVENRNRQPTTALAFVAGSRLREMGGSGEGPVSPIAIPGAPRPQPGTMPMVAAGPEGGGLLAYPAFDASGLPAVAVRQEYHSGGAQTGLLSSPQGGQVSELAIGRSGGGDGLVAFRQGEAGSYQIVAAQATLPPAAFKVTVPSHWVKPMQVKMRWEGAPSAAAPITYSVLVNGVVVKAGLRRHRYHLRQRQLGDGVLSAQVLATDRFGQQLLSPAQKLKVDGQPPIAQVRLHGRQVTVRLRDRGSGLATKATRVSFGDGARASGGSGLLHAYTHRGRFRILVRARDAAGNRLVRRFEVRVR